MYEQAATTDNHIQNIRPPRLAIAIVSGAALAYELLLIRLFSIIQWHHFAFMVISLALLGYGASGTFVAFFRNRLLKNFKASYLACVILFGFTTALCFLIAQKIQFHPEELFWNPWQPFRLLSIYLVLALPFFFAATSMALVLAHFHKQVPQLYSMDLLGAGLGSPFLILLLFAFFPAKVLLILSGIILLAGAIACLEMGTQQHWPILVLCLLALIIQFLPPSWSELEPSPYKEQSQALQISGTHILAERSSPLALLTAVDSPEVPWRHAPGMSLVSPVEPPPQIALFFDGGGLTTINQFNGDLKPLNFLDQMPSALPYHLIKPERALILGAGGGSDILQAMYHGVKAIEAVELNPQVIDMMSNEFASFAGGLFSKPEVNLHVAESRAFIRQNKKTYDLIQMNMLDSFSASAAGLHALNENHSYTVEALQEYLKDLSPNGFLSISRWLKLPPRDTLKLFATAIEAMKNQGVKQPEDHMILIRGLQTSTLLIKNSPIQEEEIASLRTFCFDRSFDMAYFPGIQANEANQYNILAEPFFYQGAEALLGEHSENFLDKYKFQLKPATDDQPFFFHFLKWNSMSEIIALRGKGGMMLVEWGYPILLAALIQGCVASLVLIVLPLRRLTRKREKRAKQWRIFVYFFCLGLAFLFLEIALMQKLVLFLGHPLYSAALVLSTILVFAGLGSNVSRTLTQKHHPQQVTQWAIMTIVALGLSFAFFLTPLIHSLLALPGWSRSLIAILLLAPPAFAMGIPFPLALAKLGDLDQALIPWAWGVNGCASVLSAILATLLAIHFGFTVVILCALGLYGLAAFTFPGKKT